MKSSYQHRHGSFSRCARLLLLGVAGWLMVSSPRVAQNGPGITLAWDAPAGSTIAGYPVNHGSSSRSFKNTFDKTTPDDVPTLSAGSTYFLAVTDYFFLVKLFLVIGGFEK